MLFFSVINYLFLYGKRIYDYFDKSDLNVSIKLTPEAIIYKTATCDMKKDWQGIYNIYESKNLFIIYYSSLTAIFVPKRAFNSEEEAKCFYNTALNYWNESKNT
jgi:hypothetical protein